MLPGAAALQACAVAFGLLLVLAGPGPTAAQDNDWAPWAERQADGGVDLTLYFFWSETCPYCARAKPHIEALAERRPWLRLESREVSGSAENRELFAGLAATVGEEIRGVPSFFLCSYMAVGFDAEARMAEELGQLADACHVKLLEAAAESPLQERSEAEPPAAAAEPPMPEALPAEPPDTTVAVPLLGRLDAGTLSLPLVTVVLGGLDAFNPCAFFVLFFLLTLLVHAHDRRRMLLIGGCFVLVSGLLYFAFMAAWLNLFLVLEGLGAVTTVAGLVAIVVAALNIKDFFLLGQGPTLSIPERAKPGLFARMRGLLSADSLPTLLGGTFALAVAANTYELLCTSGFPLVYTRILTLEALPPGGYYLYLALYNLVYVLPLAAIVGLFTATLGARRLSEGQARALKLLSGLMMLGLGLVLVLAPDLLDNLLTALGLLALALAGTLLAVALDRRHRHARG